ncbi:hypothetical protein [Nioella sp.]|uniref:hypothetical protein n=1 Tax=Nioella sp. TaxID=1912091 RepID=UPI003B51C3A5
MIMTEDGFSYSCTTCPKTGQPCAAGLRLARQLGAALRASEGTIQEDFEMTGHGQFSGACGQECDVVYSLYHKGFRVFCGVPQDTDPEALIRFSNAFLGDGPVPREPVPRAMVVGARIAQYTALTAQA